MDLSRRYNKALTQHPLVTKALTGAILSSLGELISQLSTGVVSREGQSTLKRVRGVLKIVARQPSKILLMFCYGGLINAPINHYLYGWITKYTNSKIVNVTLRRLLQLLASLLIVSPIQVGFLVSSLTVVNQNVGWALAKYPPMIKQNLRTKYFKILSSSWVTSTILVSIAQKYVEPAKWSVFFSFAYAILATGQNIYLKSVSGK
ncbi:(ZYRO0B05434g) [Zygosaccharomyces parabailii]|nr:(ZYRO0B05434g) [Zygosaccharomyces parabailii]